MLVCRSILSRRARICKLRYAHACCSLSKHGALYIERVRLWSGEAAVEGGEGSGEDESPRASTETTKPE